MKKSLLTIGLLGCLLFLSNNRSISKKMILTNLSERPVLPFPPFDYSINTLPYTAYRDTVDYGYNGVLNSAILDNIIEIDDAKATLGRVLFYDKKLSPSENISCATCHEQKKSFAGSGALSQGAQTLTKHNSLHLNDLAWEQPSRFGWDMKFESLSEMISLPLLDENEINTNIEDIITKFFNTNYYPQLFQSAYDHPKATEEKIIESLVHFILSMGTHHSRHDSEAAMGFQNFTLSEIRGLQLFSGFCYNCHKQGYGNWVPNSRSNNGLPIDPNDLGAGEWDTTFKHMFKIPTLRNIEVTAPYMHDGRFNTLEEVVQHYSDSTKVILRSGEQLLVEDGFKFSEEDQIALVDFMKTFTDSTFITNEKWSNPFKNSTSTNTITEQLPLKLYPNPMLQQSTIEFSNEQNDIAYLTIYTPSGQELFSDNTREDYYALNSADLTPGLYLLNIRIGNKKTTKNLIVK